MIPQFPVGRYRLGVEQRGFSIVVRKGNELRVGDNPRIDLTMQVVGRNVHVLPLPSGQIENEKVACENCASPRPRLFVDAPREACPRSCREAVY
jgi:hypothetical protein